MPYMASLITCMHDQCTVVPIRARATFQSDLFCFFAEFHKVAADLACRFEEVHGKKPLSRKCMALWMRMWLEPTGTA